MTMLVMSTLATVAGEVMDCVRLHEERWEDRVYAHGLDKLVESHYEKYHKDYAVERDKEHALCELAAAALFALCKLTKD